MLRTGIRPRLYFHQRDDSGGNAHRDRASGEILQNHRIRADLNAIPDTNLPQNFCPRPDIDARAQFGHVPRTIRRVDPDGDALPNDAIVTDSDLAMNDD